MIKWTPEELAEMRKADRQISKGFTVSLEEYHQAAERDRGAVEDAMDNQTLHTSKVRKAQAKRGKAKRKKYRKQYHIDNREKENAQARQYGLDHHEERLQYQHSFYSVEENKQRHRETSAAWYWAHREEINAKKRAKYAEKKVTQ